MNENSERRDEQLSGLLQSWQVDLRDDPALARKVWARLEGEKSASVAGWFERFFRLLTQPAFAAAVVAVCVALGALTAELSRAGGRPAELDRLAAEYARSIDPLLMTHPGGSSHTP